MKKLFKVLLIIFISLNAITVMSFLAYTPEDYCQRAEISEKYEFLLSDSKEFCAISNLKSEQRPIGVES